ncbi:MAG TPA: PAS domain S-box protein [Gemmatimonadales bacterium]|nr:PAS domain S-box protein [Gemmatimonadales bacterium]
MAEADLNPSDIASGERLFLSPGASWPLESGGFGELIDQIDDYAIFLTDAEGHALTWNRGVARQLGFGEAEFLGLDVALLFPPEARARGEHVRELEEAAATGRAGDDRWMLRKNGARFWASGATIAVHAHDGTLVGFAKLLRDLTERRHGEEDLRAAEKRLQAALLAARTGTWWWDIQTNAQHLDEGLRHLLGLRPGEEVHTLDEFLAHVHPNDRATLMAAFRRTANEGRDLDVEFRVVLPDGDIRWLRDQGQAVRDATGRPQSLTGACTDVTERRHADEALRQAQRLEAVGRLAGGIAHEVRNMMTAVLGFSELLMADFPAGDGRRNDLEQIRRAAGRAAAITGQLLAFSRRDLHQPEQLDLGELVDTLQPMLRRLVGANVELGIRQADDLRPVRADPGQIEQVIVNLALNARDAMPRGGRLELELDEVRLGVDYAQRHPEAAIPPGYYVRLAVSDTGTGMDAETRERAFDPFFTTKPVGQGTGLGLASVYGIVKQSGGFVWLYSEPDAGTTVKLYLPVAMSESAGEGAASEPGPLLRGTETILVVEDEDVVRDTAVRILRHAGYTCLEARNGRQALEQLASCNGAVDLVLTDLVMPDVDGRALAEALAGLRPGVPILFTSGYTGDEVQRRGLLPPDASFVSKPFDAAGLTRQVRALLERGH